jgi:hypothetical protein
MRIRMLTLDTKTFLYTRIGISKLGSDHERDLIDALIADD